MFYSQFIIHAFFNFKRHQGTNCHLLPPKLGDFGWLLHYSEPPFLYLYIGDNTHPREWHEDSIIEAPASERQPGPDIAPADSLCPSLGDAASRDKQPRQRNERLGQALSAALGHLLRTPRASTARLPRRSERLSGPAARGARRPAPPAGPGAASPHPCAARRRVPGGGGARRSRGPLPSPCASRRPAAGAESRESAATQREGAADCAPRLQVGAARAVRAQGARFRPRPGPPSLRPSALQPHADRIRALRRRRSPGRLRARFPWSSRWPPRRAPSRRGRTAALAPGGCWGVRCGVRPRVPLASLSVCSGPLACRRFARAVV